MSALDIRLHRKNMEVPQDLRDTAERKLHKLEAFLDESGWVELGFVEEQNPRISAKYHCEIVAHLKGHRLKVEGAAGDPLAALEAAVHKVDRQVRRLKDKRTRRPWRRKGGNHQGRRPVDEAALAEVAPIETPPPATEAVDADDEVPMDPDDVEGDGLPRITEVGESDAKPMTPVEAALQAETLGHEFLLFHNAETGRAAVVYRRRAGDYGLIETPA